MPPEALSEAAPAPKPRRRWPRALAWSVGAVLLGLAVLVGGITWTWRSDPGLSWLLAQVPGLQITGARGRPDGGAFEAERLAWRGAGVRVELEGLSWRDLQWQWRPYSGAWVRVAIDAPRARRVLVTTTPAGPAKAPSTGAPSQLRLPVELVLRGLGVDTLQVNELPAARAVQADLHLGDDRGARHRVTRLTLEVSGIQANAQGVVATAGDLTAQAQLRLATPAGAALPWTLQAQLGGTLPQLRVQAALRAAAAMATAQATVTPFAAWPMSELQAALKDLDLAALQPGWPATRLSGQVVLRGAAADAPITAEVQLDNAAPGAWSAGRLPVRSVRGTVRGSLQDRQTLAFSGLDLALQGRSAAGRLAGSGRWQGSALQLSLVLQGLQPSQLDARLPVMTLAGPVELRLQGLPSPDPAARVGAAAPLAGSVQARIEGQAQTPGSARQPVTLAADASFSAAPDGALQLQARQLQASAGAARATVSGVVSREAASAAPRWALRGEGGFTRFDPSVWWPGAPRSAWRRGPHALSGSWRADLALPAAALQGPPRALAQALRGTAALELADSRLAGVALQGKVELKAADTGTRFNAALQAAGNRAVVDLSTAAASADRWRADIQAPAIAALRPVAALVPGGAERWPLAGSLRAQGSAEGQWPNLQTQGDVQATALRSPTWQVGAATARWSAHTGRADAPLTLRLDARALALGAQRVDSLAATLDGSLRSHRLQVQADSPVRPPSWADTAAAPPAALAGTRLRVDASGAWQPAPAGGGSWRGQIAEVRAAARTASATPWVHARGLSASATVGAQGQLTQAAVAPGQVELLGATLQWAEAAYEAGATGRAPRLRVQATLEPLAVAPWLARLQPQADWQGDLRVGASIRISRGDAFDADIVLQRAAGDISVRRDTRRQPLGLTGLRLALSAHRGTWELTQAATGTQLGVMAGLQTVRTGAGDAWPRAGAPISGVVELQSPELDVWSAWLPAGWRLGGALRLSALLSGSFGAPAYRGRIDGSNIAVGNLFQGIDFKDGTVAVALQGEQARIERLGFRSGAGRIDATGGATFGAAPEAQLRVVASRFEALSRVDRRLVVSGSAELSLKADAVVVDGRVGVDEGLIDVTQADARRLDSDVVVVNRTRAAPTAAPGSIPAAEALPGAPTAAAPRKAPVTALMRNSRIALQIDLGNALRLRGRGIDTRLGGQLRVSNPGGRLAVNGNVLTQSGTYAAYGQNLVIERGVIRFDGELAMPRIDIFAIRPDIDPRVGVSIVGSPVDPRVRLVSEPEMSEMDKLSWLMMGRAPSGLGRADTALLQQAALSLLAGEKGSSTPGLVKRLGLDQLSVGQTGSGDARDTVITLGKQLSQRLFVGYERGLESTTGSWQLIYRVARRFTLRASAGEASALDAIWTWRW